MAIGASLAVSLASLVCLALLPVRPIVPVRMQRMTCAVLSDRMPSHTLHSTQMLRANLVRVLPHILEHRYASQVINGLKGASINTKPPESLVRLMSGFAVGAMLGALRQTRRWQKALPERSRGGPEGVQRGSRGGPEG
eukprot:8986646-Pyramimonas_sp.AAC.2